MKKNVSILDMNISYLENESTSSHLCLVIPGWLEQKEIFSFLLETQNIHIVILDLPGFFESDTPQDILTHEKYCNIISSFLSKFTYDTLTLLGHSFGGKISCIYASIYSVDQLVLISSAGIIHRKNIKTRFKIHLAKICKFLHIKSNFGSKDYKASSSYQRELMKYTLKIDIRDILCKIESETLIIWGSHDLQTPVKDAYIFRDKIKSSRLIVLPSVGHFSFLSQQSLVSMILGGFFAHQENNYE